MERKEMSLTDVEMVFLFLGGLGMFLFGMDAMAKGLQQYAGGKMKHLMGVLTGNRFLGVLMGAIITAIIQSSSATTVMIVGFVNAGIMNLTQAVGVIMGANIGTTITSWIVSMSEWGKVLKPEFFAPVLVFIGVILFVFIKNNKKKEVGEIFIGLGLLFIGLSFMSDAITPYREAQIFKDAFHILGKNPILGILTGAVVTAIIQSSSASVGILQTLALNGIVNFRSAIFITLGQNIGTCVTALISSTGAHRTAKRAAVIHLLFNVCGTVLFGILMYLLFWFNGSLADSSISTVQISIFHTIFNVTNTLLLFPFANQLVKLSGIIIKEKEDTQKTEITVLKDNLDDRILETPPFALSVVQKEILYMGEITLENANKAIKAILENEREVVAEVLEKEEVINEFEKILTEYLVKINNCSLDEKEYDLVKDYMNTVSDLERIGDHAENLAELAENKIKHGIHFSEEATKDIKEIYQYVSSAVQNALDARREEKPEFIRAAFRFEEIVDNLEKDFREKHITRLANGECNIEAGVIFLDAISNLERISDHADNIAGYVKNAL